jgi:hypothetical protein
MNTRCPNTSRLQLDITYRCGLNCHNCNRFTQLVPGDVKDDTTVAQVEKLLADSVRINHQWGELDLLGGEPTLHPEVVRMAGLLDDYRAAHAPQCILRLYSHGNGKARMVAQDIKARYPAYQVVVNQNTIPPAFAIKTGVSKEQFYAASMAPIDRHPEWKNGRIFEGCVVSWSCGMGMNYRGYYCCAIAAAIDRVFRFGQAIADLSGLTQDAIEKQYQTFCPLCGHYEEIRCGNEQTWLSPTWERALGRLQ